MKQIKFLSMLLALVMVFGSLLGTTALAATTTTAVSVVATEQADEAEATAAEEAPQKKSLGKQILILIAFAAGVGLLAAGYGLTTMRYNQEKMDDMTDESRKIMERMRDNNE